MSKSANVRIIIGPAPRTAMQERFAAARQEAITRAELLTADDYLKIGEDEIRSGRGMLAGSVGQAAGQRAYMVDEAFDRIERGMAMITGVLKEMRR